MRQAGTARGVQLQVCSQRAQGQEQRPGMQVPSIELVALAGWMLKKGIRYMLRVRTRAPRIPFWRVETGKDACVGIPLCPAPGSERVCLSHTDLSSCYVAIDHSY